MKIYKDLTHHWSKDYLLRDNSGKLLFKGSKLGCKTYIKLSKVKVKCRNYVQNR